MVFGLFCAKLNLCFARDTKKKEYSVGRLCIWLFLSIWPTIIFISEY